MNMQMQMHLPSKVNVDNFCGGGGASLGLEMGVGMPIDIAVNHKPEALGMHAANHPHADHHCESVWDVVPAKATNGRTVANAWFSPDCRHFSRAKGGAPVSKSVRGLAWVKLRWLLDCNVEDSYLENVQEFLSWGPMDEETGKPIAGREGETFDAFVKMMTTGISTDHPAYRECLDFLGLPLESTDAKRLARGLGRHVDWRVLSACDYGAPTSRERLFMVTRDSLPVAWPKQTHGAPDDIAVQKGALKPWRTAAECIDWSVPVTSIFSRSRPLAEASAKRVTAGIFKKVINCKAPFVVDEPVPIVGRDGKPTGSNEAAVIAFIDQYRGGGGAWLSGVDTPIHDASQGPRLVVARLAAASNDVETPQIRKTWAFLVKYYSQGGQWGDLGAPMPTIPTKDRLALVLVRGTLSRIEDIGYRMLQPHELYKAQGFPANYQHTKWITPDGHIKNLTKAEQTFMCGNSVSPVMAKAIAQAQAESRAMASVRSA